jgi:D-alanyl-D-alanine carboxypeptidase
MIQVGAFDDEVDAKRRLVAAQTQASDALKTSDPFVESVKKGNKTLYRARFNGFEKDLAEIACKQLRRGEIPCMLLKN